VKHFVCFVCLIAGCGSGTGSLEVFISGEEAAVDGYPVGDIGFVDGWTLEFDVLTIAIHDFELRGADGDDAMITGEPLLVDLTSGESLGWTFEGVPARRWEDVRYRIGPAVSGARELGDIDPAVRDRMTDEGLAIYVEATAEKDGTIRRIEFAIAADVQHSRCVGTDETDGLIVASNQQNEAQVTTHWDHLFFDSLALDQANMRFDAIAAVATDETPITLEDLSAQRLADLEVLYDPASTPLSEPTLRAMIEALAITVGHFQGEGHCEYAPR
jgi:hypothetical protein